MFQLRFWEKRGDSPVRYPYLSIVIVSRNDAYGGGLPVLQVCLNSLLTQIEHNQLVSELILVEWNPPPDSPGLIQALSWQNRTDFCTVRVIQVPAGVHKQFKFGDKLPVLIHRARNVGIRRARGTFVFPTGNDILFSDALMRFLASGQLQLDRMYRVDRYDVPATAASLSSSEAQLAYCEQNVLRIYGRDGSSPTKDSSNESVRLHTRACGDFTLLSKVFWDKVHGIPEEHQFHSAHFDSVLCYVAQRAGAKEVVLFDPMRIYHIEHESVWRTQRSERIEEALAGGYRFLERLAPQLMPQLATQVLRLLRRRTRMQTLGIPYVNPTQYYRLIRKIKESREVFVLNNDTWGLAGENLPESVPVLANWDEVTSIKKACHSG